MSCYQDCQSSQLLIVPAYFIFWSFDSCMILECINVLGNDTKP
uniref:Uncharacterized protein n=1 Tax=Rhizophora mucronata TaxID=61149 RepID=A0A2P2NDH5_RHIMU